MSTRLRWFRPAIFLVADAQAYADGAGAGFGGKLLLRAGHARALVGGEARVGADGSSAETCRWRTSSAATPAMCAREREFRRADEAQASTPFCSPFCFKRLRQVLRGRRRYDEFAGVTERTCV